MATKKPNTEEVKKSAAKKTATKATKVVAKKTTAKKTIAKKTTDKVTTPPKKAPVKRNPKQAALPLPACTVDDLKSKKAPKIKNTKHAVTLEDLADTMVENHIKSEATPVQSEETPPFDPPYKSEPIKTQQANSRKGITITELMQKKAAHVSSSPLDGFFVPRK